MSFNQFESNRSNDALTIDCTNYELLPILFTKLISAIYAQAVIILFGAVWFDDRQPRKNASNRLRQSVEQMQNSSRIESIPILILQKKIRTELTMIRKFRFMFDVSIY